MRSLLDEGMLEQVSCLRGQTSLIEQLCLNEPPQALLQCGFVHG
jgi:hypothetical protein